MQVTKKIGDILTDEQVGECVRIVKIHHKPIEELKVYLTQFKADLEKKGVDADFLAYMVFHILTK